MNNISRDVILTNAELESLYGGGAYNLPMPYLNGQSGLYYTPGEWNNLSTGTQIALWGQAGINYGVGVGGSNPNATTVSMAGGVVPTTTTSGNVVAGIVIVAGSAVVKAEGLYIMGLETGYDVVAKAGNWVNSEFNSMCDSIGDAFNSFSDWLGNSLEYS